MRVAVTGARGRLGRALVDALGAAPFVGPRGPIAWDRSAFDLDSPTLIGPLIERDRPEMIVHAAAWTDVDGCARQPELAMARNGVATRVLAEASAERGVDLLLISTNEVFDGRRGDGRGYRPDDETSPINPYGESKLAGEKGAAAAYSAVAGAGSLAIVRTAWLFGPPGIDFPAKILAAAERARAAGEPLRLVADETGSPTYSQDLAEAIVVLIGGDAVSGIKHIVNTGTVTRADWARELLRRAGLDVASVDVPATTWPRPAPAPAWAVLEPTPLPSGELLRSWQDALAEYVPLLLRLAEASVG